MTYDLSMVTAAFNRLFSTYPQFGTADDTEAARAYFDAIAPYETQDIETAVRNFLSGSAPGHNPAYAPSAPLVGAEVRRVMNLRLDRERRAALRRPALPAPQIEHSPESRDRVAAMVEDLKQRTASALLTEDAAEAHRRDQLAARTNARFAPDMTPAAVRKRLGFGVGDADGEAV